MAATVKVTWSWWTAVIRTRPFDVLIDDEVVDSLPPQTSVEVDVEPGRHTLQVQAGRRGSRRRVIEVADGQVAAFNAKPFYILWPVFVASFALPNMAIALSRQP
ncbi:MAG TPA: hypothetical protein VKV06_16840 [Acidimicrobiales bacterium]|nr:hypothetical protein [Acidimicrobiales bacterium]